MRGTILSVAVLLAAAAVVAGCGGGSRGSTVVAGGGQHSMDKGSFRASVHGFQAELQRSVQAFRSGNLSKAASGAGLLTTCSSAVGKLSDQATTPIQRLAVSHLRLACRNMSQASNAGMSGHMAQARQFAQGALKQAQIASQLTG